MSKNEQPRPDAAEPRVETSPRVDSERRAARDYWDAHPISVDSVPHAPGSKESFDAIYERWERTADVDRAAFLNSAKEAGDVLEIGCGIAIDGRFLSENGVRYFAVDHSINSLSLARRHLSGRELPARLTNGDGICLPFADESFGMVYSIGVLHHLPDTPRACREVVRVARPGGTVRIMFYHRHSYHYLLVDCVVRPLVWLMLELPFLAVLAKRGPAKLRETYDICRQHGFDRKRILDVSTDTSVAGDSNYNPLSQFFTEAEMRDIFSELEDFRFFRSDLKYFPLPFLRDFVEARWGFFLTMTARKPAGSPSRGA